MTRLVPTPGTDSYSEDFTTTTYQNAGATNAQGWGNGTITNPRTYNVQLLDYYSTSDRVRSVDVQGRKAYIGVDETSGVQDLQILNITDPSYIVQLANRPAPLKTFDVDVEGDTLYVGSDYDLDGDGDLFTYNVSDPYTIPAPLDFVYDIVGYPVGLDVQGHFLYVAAYDIISGRFLIYDVEDPNNIIQVNSWSWACLLDVHVVGQLAYMAHGLYGLKICNVSDPFSPFIQGSVNTPGNATSVLVDGNIAYVADADGGLQIVDVSNSSSPTIIGSYDAAVEARRLALQGDTLYVADGSNGLVILDVADPTHPILVERINLPYTWDVDLYGADVVVATDGGVYTLRIGYNLAALPLIGTFAGYEAWDVRVQGDVAYVAAGPDGLLTLDVSDPANPVLLDQDTTGASRFYRKLDVQGNLAFVADYGNAFRVFDISDPTNIKFLDSRGLSYATDVAVAGDTAFIADGTSGVYIYNVSNPYNIPSPITSIGGLHNVTALWVQGYHLYIAGEGFDDDITIYNILDISNPTPVHIAASGSTDQYDIFVDGDTCYNVAVNPEVSVYYDVTNPYNPSWTGGVLFATVGEPRGVWGFGPYMLAANYSGGIALIEAYHNNMDVIASYTGPTRALQLTVDGDFVYVANRTSLMILRLFRSAGSTYATGTHQAVSVEVDTTARTIENATLTYNAYIPPGTSITFEMSADGGTHWETVTPGLEHSFTNTGNNLRWRAIINTPLDDRSVHLYSVNINYEYNDLPTAPTLTDPGDTDDDGAFTVSWSASTDDGSIASYLLQMSDSNTFTNILDSWTPTTTSRGITGLTNDTYYFRVRAVDDDGESGPWSNIEDITVAIPPTSTTPTSPPIPGFPIEAIAIGAILAVGLGLIQRRKRSTG